jgi:carbamoyl-phosphate synthase large subunit
VTTVLVTGVGGPAGSAVVQSLRQAPQAIRVVGVDSNPFAGGFVKVDAHRAVPVATATDYMKAIGRVVAVEKVDAIIPTVEEEIPVYAAASKDRHLPAPTAVPAPEAVTMAQDKLFYGQAFGVPVPATLKLPLILKHRVGRGAKGFRVLAESNTIAQEKIDGEIYLAQGLAKDGSLLRSVVTKRLTPRVGPATSAVTVIEEEIVELLAQITARTAWFGALGVEFIRRADGTLFLIDVNPRICGQSHLATMAGMNLAYGLVQLALGQEITIPSAYDEDVIFGRAWEDVLL